MTDLVVLSALAGLAAFYLTLLVRKVFREAVERDIKPAACLTCMSGWTAALACDAASLSPAWGFAAWQAWAPAAGLALYLLKRVEPSALPPPPPPVVGITAMKAITTKFKVAALPAPARRP